MKVSYQWLKKYFAFEKTPEELSEILTQTGLEVEGIEYHGKIKGGLNGVVTGKVISCDPHPDADRLKLTTVDIKNEILSIVCGAPNVAEGQKVLVALVGTTIYPLKGEPLTLRKAKIRGYESNGMICAEDELGLGSSHDGILILPADTEIGLSAAEALNIESDAILEIGLTPNRCDAMGHYGVARDIRAFLNHHEAEQVPMTLPVTQALSPWDPTNLTLELKSDDLCSAYYLASITGIKLSKSPDWLIQSLESIGVGTINNIVDCANFVMHELGTPLHVFDAQSFTKSLTVRLAHEGETLVTLDGVERKLLSSDLVIDGDGKAQCLAGVMGGKESGVKETTVDIYIESAYFNASSIRKTAKHHSIHSDASFRFERGVDPALTKYALERIVGMIQEIAGGKIQGYHCLTQSPLIPVALKLDFKSINHQLGTSLSDEEIQNILISLDFKCTSDKLWAFPLYRTDVQRPIDVVEEIIRIAGFDAVPTPKKWQFSVPISEHNTPELLRNKISHILAGNGYFEIMNNSLTKLSYEELITSKQEGHAIKLKNPLSRDLSMLRSNLLLGMLETIQYNRNRQASNLQLFEFGNTYHAFGTKTIERSGLALAITGTQNPESWLGSRPSSFFDLKSSVLRICGLLNAPHIEETSCKLEGPFTDGLDLKINGVTLATIGIIKKEWLQMFDLKQPVFAAVLDWKKFLELYSSNEDRYYELPKTFQVRRDFALLLDRHVSFASLSKMAQKVTSERLVDIQLFDVYEGANIGSDKKSYALSFHFRDNNKTLTDQEIDSEMNAIRTCFEKEFNAQLR